MDKTFGGEFLQDLDTMNYGCNACNDNRGMAIYIDGTYSGTVDPSAPGGIDLR